MALRSWEALRVPRRGEPFLIAASWALGSFGKKASTLSLATDLKVCMIWSLAVLPSVEVRQAGSDFPGSKGAGAEDQQAACNGGSFGCLAKPFGSELLGGYRLEVDRIG
jgi:hypothetical protein